MPEEFDIKIFPYEINKPIDRTKEYYIECVLLKFYQRIFTDIFFLFPDEYALYLDPICPN